MQNIKDDPSSGAEKIVLFEQEDAGFQYFNLKRELRKIDPKDSEERPLSFKEKQIILRSILPNLCAIIQNCRTDRTIHFRRALAVITVVVVSFTMMLNTTAALIASCICAVSFGVPLRKKEDFLYKLETATKWLEEPELRVLSEPSASLSKISGNKLCLKKDGEYFVVAEFDLY